MLGNLNQRASILARTIVPDGGGGAGESWQSVGAAWVAIALISGADVFGPDADESRARYRITARRADFLAAGRRVVIGARTFAIQAVLDDGAPGQLVDLICEELP
jgi:SPP1 family predicted phage head-tail adaptor